MKRHEPQVDAWTMLEVKSLLAKDHRYPRILSLIFLATAGVIHKGRKWEVRNKVYFNLGNKMNKWICFQVSDFQNVFSSTFFLDDSFVMD